METAVPLPPPIVPLDMRLFTVNITSFDGFATFHLTQELDDDGDFVSDLPPSPDASVQTPTVVTPDNSPSPDAPSSFTGKVT